METIKIVNRKQAQFYKDNGVMPTEEYIGYNCYPVFVFNKCDTKEVWQLWRKKDATKRYHVVTSK